MKVSRADVIDLLKASRHSDPKSLSNSRLETKLAKLAKDEGFGAELDDRLSAVLNSVRSAVSQGSTVTIDGARSEEPTESKSTKKKSKEKGEGTRKSKGTTTEKASQKEKPKKTKNPDEKPRERRKEKQGVDKFGMRLGTRAATINSVLSRHPKSISVLLKESGVKPPIQNHLRKLMDKGFVEKTDDGNYRLVSSK